MNVISRDDPQCDYRAFPSAIDCFLANADTYRAMGVTMFAANYPGFYKKLCRDKTQDKAFPDKQRGIDAPLHDLKEYDYMVIRVARKKYGDNSYAGSRALGYPPGLLRRVWDGMDKERRSVNYPRRLLQ